MRVNNKKNITGTARKRNKPMIECDKSKYLDTYNDYEVIFNFLIKEAEKNNLSDGSDSIIISALAKELVLYHTCMADVDSRGPVIIYYNGAQQMEQINPSYKAAKIALDNVKALAKESGFTMRSRILMSSHFIKKEEEVDPIAELLKRAG